MGSALKLGREFGHGQQNVDLTRKPTSLSDSSQSFPHTSRPNLAYPILAKQIHFSEDIEAIKMMYHQLSCSFYLQTYPHPYIYIYLRMVSSVFPLIEGRFHPCFLPDLVSSFILSLLHLSIYLQPLPHLSSGKSLPCAPRPLTTYPSFVFKLLFREIFTSCIYFLTSHWLIN